MIARLPGADFEGVREAVLATVAADERVLEDPPPSAFIMSADASGVQMTVYCWVMNENFLGARSDLWLQLMTLAESASNALPLALPRQVVELSGDGDRGERAGDA